MHTAQSLSTLNMRINPSAFKPDDVWVEGVFTHPLYPNGCWFLAQVFNERSNFGYGNGRVSKLDIMPYPNRVYGEDYGRQVGYIFDRHRRVRDKTGFPQAVVRALVKELEALPELYIPNA